MLTGAIIAVSLALIWSIAALVGLVAHLYRERRAENGRLAVRHLTPEQRGTLLEQFLRRAPYFTALLSIALIQARDEPHRILLCRLQSGEFGGEWQFPAGYIHPDDKAQIANPRLKADYEIEKALGIDAARLEYLRCLTDNNNTFEYKYSNPGRVRAMIYEYAVSNRVLDTLPVEYRLVDASNIESTGDLGAPIAIHVFDVLRYYLNIVLSEDFRKRLDEFKRERENVMEDARRAAVVDIGAARARRASEI